MAGPDQSSDDPVERARNEYRMYRRTVTADPEDGFHDLLHAVADLEGCDVESLPPLYDRVDHLVEHLFEQPPSPKAQAEIQFTYYDYRITLDQLGNVSLRKQHESLDERGPG